MDYQSAKLSVHVMTMRLKRAESSMLLPNRTPPSLALVSTLSDGAMDNYPRFDLIVFRFNNDAIILIIFDSSSVVMSLLCALT